MKKVVSLFVMLVVVMSMVACSSKQKLDTETLCEINISGLNEHATAKVNVNYEMLTGILSDIETKDGFAKSMEVAMFFDSVNYKIVSEKTENLSNGDVLEIELVYNKDSAKKLGYAFSKDKFKYKIEGLEEGEVIDPFAGLVVEYEGVSGRGSYHLDILKCDPFVVENVRFTSATNGNLSNGETLTLKANVDESKLVNNKIIFTETTKDFKVEGLSELITSLKGINTDEAEEKMIAELENDLSKTLSWGDIPKSKAAINFDFELENLYYFVKKDDAKTNQLVAIIKVDADYEFIGDFAPFQSNKEFKKGDKHKTTEYILVNTSDIIVTDGKVEIPHTIFTKTSKDEKFDDLGLANSYAKTLVGNAQIEQVK